MFVPERKRPPRQTVARTPALAKVAAALFILCFLPQALSAASASKALKEYGSGKYERALHQYQDLLRTKPDEPRLNFNAGDAAFQAGMYDRAMKHFNSSLATEDLQLQERAFYNLGNTHYRLGDEENDPSKKKASWEQSVNSYESALKLNPNDSDAKYNLELAKKRLEELKQQEQKKDQKQDKSDENKDQKQDQQNQSKSDQQKEQEKKEQQQKQQDKKEDQQKEQQAQKPDEKQDKKDQGEQQQAQPQSGDEDKPDEEEPQQPGDKTKMIRMTPQQAIRLLEAAKNDERTMVFLPPMKTNRNDRVFKDW
jgi:Ca-activated chloride channel family protein